MVAGLMNVRARVIQFRHSVVIHTDTYVRLPQGQWLQSIALVKYKYEEQLVHSEFQFGRNGPWPFGIAALLHHGRPVVVFLATAAALLLICLFRLTSVSFPSREGVDAKLVPFDYHTFIEVSSAVSCTFASTGASRRRDIR